MRGSWQILGIWHPSMRKPWETKPVFWAVASKNRHHSLSGHLISLKWCVLVSQFVSLCLSMCEGLKRKEKTHLRETWMQCKENGTHPWTPMELRAPLNPDPRAASPVSTCQVIQPVHHPRPLHFPCIVLSVCELPVRSICHTPVACVLIMSSVHLPVSLPLLFARWPAHLPVFTHCLFWTLSCVSLPVLNSCLTYL